MMAWWSGHPTKRGYGKRAYRKAAGKRARRAADREEIVLDAADHANVHLEIAERLRERFGEPTTNEETPSP